MHTRPNQGSFPTRQVKNPNPCKSILISVYMLTFIGQVKLFNLAKAGDTDNMGGTLQDREF